MPAHELPTSAHASCMLTLLGVSGERVRDKEIDKCGARGCTQIDARCYTYAATYTLRARCTLLPLSRTHTSYPLPRTPAAILHYYARTVAPASTHTSCKLVLLRTHTSCPLPHPPAARLLSYARTRAARIRVNQLQACTPMTAH